MKIKIFLFIIIFGGITATSQGLILLNKELYKARVKLVDEFFARFDGKELAPGINPNAEDAQRQNLCLLLDFDAIKSNIDYNYAAAIEFVDTIIANNTQVNYTDTLWYAKADCSALLNGKPVELTLFLTVEHRQKNMWKWVINNAGGECLDLHPAETPKNTMILPDDHEINFMSLSHITKGNYDRITLFAQKGYGPDPLTSFFSLVYNGLLKIEYVRDLEFTFLQVPGYEFTIRFFERDSSNSGWLISSFTKKTEDEKNKTIKTILKR